SSGSRMEPSAAANLPGGTTTGAESAGAAVPADGSAALLTGTRRRTKTDPSTIKQDARTRARFTARASLRPRDGASEARHSLRRSVWDGSPLDLFKASVRNHSISDQTGRVRVELVEGLVIGG